MTYIYIVFILITSIEVDLIIFRNRSFILTLASLSKRANKSLRILTSSSGSQVVDKAKRELLISHAKNIWGGEATDYMITHI